MSDKEKITEILKAYTKKHNIMASSVILEEYAEELIANGVIVPPCKVGDKIYYPSASFNRIFEKTVDEIMIHNIDGDIGCYVHFASSYMPFENIGKTVFLTKEEAEEKLKELGK